MPIITGPIRPNDSGQVVVDLHMALLKYGAPIADAEKSSKRFGDSTLAAVLAFRSQHGLPPVTGTASPFDASVGRLLNVAAAAADGNRAAMRTAVRESVAAASTATPQENYWLARCGFGRHVCQPVRTYTAFR
jgi:peptidoglycan hydrolase-like protein with peptidoglycan-binding domain